jgi:hypothetical protein
MDKGQAEGDGALRNVEEILEHAVAGYAAAPEPNRATPISEW